MAFHAISSAVKMNARRLAPDAAHSTLELDRVFVHRRGLQECELESRSEGGGVDNLKC